MAVESRTNGIGIEESIERDPSTTTLLEAET